jgi:hypothetical protein
MSRSFGAARVDVYLRQSSSSTSTCDDVGTRRGDSLRLAPLGRGGVAMGTRGTASRDMDSRKMSSPNHSVASRRSRIVMFSRTASRVGRLPPRPVVKASITRPPPSRRSELASRFCCCCSW